MSGLPNNDVGELNYKLSADTTQFEAALDKAKQGADTLAADLEKGGTKTATSILGRINGVLVQLRKLRGIIGLIISIALIGFKGVAGYIKFFETKFADGQKKGTEFLRALQKEGKLAEGSIEALSERVGELEGELERRLNNPIMGRIFGRTKGSIESELKTIQRVLIAQLRTRSELRQKEAAIDAKADADEAMADAQAAEEKRQAEIAAAEQTAAGIRKALERELSDDPVALANMDYEEVMAELAEAAENATTEQGKSDISAARKLAAEKRRLAIESAYAEADAAQYAWEESQAAKRDAELALAKEAAEEWGRLVMDFEERRMRAMESGYQRMRDAFENQLSGLSVSIERLNETLQTRRAAGR